MFSSASAGEQFRFRGDERGRCGFPVLVLVVQALVIPIDDGQGPQGPARIGDTTLRTEALLMLHYRRRKARVHTHILHSPSPACM